MRESFSFLMVMIIALVGTALLSLACITYTNSPKAEFVIWMNIFSTSALLIYVIVVISLVQLDFANEIQTYIPILNIFFLKSCIEKVELKRRKDLLERNIKSLRDLIDESKLNEYWSYKND